ncbi:MAG: hypothetical protein ETSY1_25140 [Candidatus Entotheonella factor]|uniref:Phasin domain-containing protein n=1 Tax=Entotheonella factor TaxID=1429438 RepID=W4LG12_ENTF1|nr:MAG: hypothetical protein ETSY1_25140 [Candidatus Entotheonella factor]
MAEQTQAKTPPAEPVNPATQWANKAFEVWSAYADANLKATRQWTDFAANATKESVSLYAELQAANVEALQEGQAYIAKRISDMPAEMMNPKDACQKAMSEFGTSAEKFSKLVQSNTHAVIRSTEQYWLTAQKTGNSIRDTYSQAYEKLTTLYTSS